MFSEETFSKVKNLRLVDLPTNSFFKGSLPQGILLIPLYLPGFPHPTTHVIFNQQVVGFGLNIDDIHHRFFQKQFDISDFFI